MKLLDLEFFAFPKIAPAVRSCAGYSWRSD
jgi:hypothetical protein